MQGNALINWIIDSVDNANYRKGALTGWKHPKVDAKMIAAVGGHAALLQQAKEIEDDPVLFKQFIFRLLPYRFCAKE